MRATASQAAPPLTSTNAELVTQPPSVHLMGSSGDLGKR